MRAELKELVNRDDCSRHQVRSRLLKTREEPEGNTQSNHVLIPTAIRSWTMTKKER